MAATIDTAEVGGPRQDRSGRPQLAHRPAQLAAARVSCAGLALGVLGLASCGLVALGLVQSWRVAPHLSGHRVSLLGQPLTYPAANIWAILILALAVVGLLVAAMTVAGAVSELRSSRRLGRELRRRSVGALSGAQVLDEPRPAAFCAGLLRPRVFISNAALELLDPVALEAVLAHELQHARRRDPLRLAAGRVIARALFFVPGLRELARRQRALAELGADEVAGGEGGANRPALARAMLSFADAARPGTGIEPARVDFLLGAEPSWRFPSLVCVGAAAVIASLAGVAVVVGNAASASATLAPPFLSQQPCVLVLALIPAALWLLAAGLRRALPNRDA